jgi:hypothetical protein
MSRTCTVYTDLTLNGTRKLVSSRAAVRRSHAKIVPDAPPRRLLHSRARRIEGRVARRRWTVNYTARISFSKNIGKFCRSNGDFEWLAVTLCKVGRRCLLGFDKLCLNNEVVVTPIEKHAGAPAMLLLVMRILNLTMIANAKQSQPLLLCPSH